MNRRQRKWMSWASAAVVALLVCRGMELADGVGVAAGQCGCAAAAADPARL